MATLPAATDFTGAAITEAQFKTAITDQRTFLADLLGTDGTAASALATMGAICGSLVTKTVSYTVIASDRGKLINYTGTYTLSLTAAATLGAGFSFAVKNTGSGIITIDPSSAEAIDGGATMLLYGGESVIIICDGSAWQTVGKSSGVPAGSIMHYAAVTVPGGWLEANGAAVSRTTYATLFAAIGATFGPGDGVTTFNLPDLRGEFLRGFDNGRGVDSGRVLGSAQASQMSSHTHTVIHDTSSGSYTTALYKSSNTSNPSYTTATSPAGGTENSSETRPRNIALLACIKY